MTNMSVVMLFMLLFAGATLLIIGGGTLIYYFIYKHVINKRLAEGVTNKKKMLSPLWMPLILLLVMVAMIMPILLTIVIAAAGAYSVVTSTETHVVSTGMEIGMYSAEEMAEGYRSVYSMDSNAGYTKSEETSGIFEFTCFSAEELTDELHPHYLVYVDADADIPQDSILLVEGTLLENGEPVSGYSQALYSEDMPTCIISGMEEDAWQNSYTLHLTCHVLSADAETDLNYYLSQDGAFPDAYVLHTGEVTFELNSAEE
ncbi:MAG: hypothetical protein IJN57_10940 [Oscillospiraceae bacterium]|nr:hypothetical protein [Oscillospiraceae bacterium]